MTTKKTSNLTIIVLTVIGLALSVITAGTIVSQQSLTSNGNVNSNIAGGGETGGDTGGAVSSDTVEVSIYSDAACTVPCSSVDWGSLSPGDSVNRTVYVKNAGNVAVSLSLSTMDWSPVSASSVLTLTWNRQGSTLAAGAVAEATLTLTVAQDTGSLTDFDFDIVISGSA